LLSILSRWPGWAIVGAVALVIVGSVAYAGVSLGKHGNVAVVSGAQHCASQPTKLASLFSDGETTMIRLSNPDYTDMRVLRTEPANVLPGMFDALLSLSGDSSRLAYVTAANELMDDAHLEYIDVTNPSARVDLGTVSKGFWVVRPAWSPDNKTLAYVRLDQNGGSAGQFELWQADTSTQPATLTLESDINPENFTGGRSSTICWTASKRVVLVPSSPLTLPSPSPTSAAASPIASPSAKTGSPCGVPMFSQNDPAWRDAVMQAGTDTIGGAGCALTSTAMMLNYFGSSLTPAQLNTCLGGRADPLVWKAVTECTNGLIGGGDQIDFTWPDLDALLAAGRPAIVGMLGGKQGSHFVVVTAGGGGVADSYRITDPWDATNNKTLASYINFGYTPTWIISYTGAGHNCARLIKGLVPSITGIDPSKPGKGPVTPNIKPGTKYVKHIGMMKLSSGAIEKDTYNLPLTFTPLIPGTTISADGIYQILVTIQAPSNPPRFELYRFTIDNTPPSVDLTLLNPRAPSDRAAALGGDAGAVSAPRYPLIDKPGKIQIASNDTLSGVREIKYSLDGAPLAEYSSDTTFSRVLLVPQSGDHSIRMQAFDAAGNIQDVTKFFTVYGYIPPPPPPTAAPTHPPTSNPTTAPPPPPTCPTKITGALAAQQVAGTYPPIVAVNWNLSGGCGPFTGTITANYAGQAVYKTYPITSEQGALRDAPPSQNGCPTGTLTVVYTLTLKDTFNQSITLVQKAGVYWGCIA